jgi:hypothetical protein
MDFPSGITEFFLQWKELVGALLGGLFAMLVAFIVARDARSREERLAATLVLSALVRFIARHKALEDLAKKQDIQANDRHLWLGEKLTQSYSKLTLALESSIARLLITDMHLAVNLELFRFAHEELDVHVERLTKDYTDFSATGDLSRPKELVESDSRQATQSFDFAARHAGCAALRIQKVVLSKFSAWNRIRMQIRPSEEEKACIALSTSSDH